MRQRVGVLSAVCLALSLASGCTNEASVTPAAGAGAATATSATSTPTASAIKIAVVGPMSGSAAAFGEMMRSAVYMKVDEVNAAGGVGGRQVEVVIEDDRGDTTEAANVSRKLAGDKSVAIVVGHFNSTCSNASKEEYNRKGVVQFTPASTNVSVCAGSPWTFRNLYRDDYQGLFLARYAKQVLGAKRAAVFFDNDDYGKGLMEAFSAEAAKIGLEMLEPIPYLRERTQDFKPLASQVAEKGADVVFVSGLYNEAALIAKALRNDLGLQMPIVAGDGVMNDDFIKIAERAAEGVYVTTPFLFEAAKENAAAKAFFESFNESYGKNPDTWAALAYDAVGMALVAIGEVGTEREAIRDWLAAVTTRDKAYNGITGPTWFDAEGDCPSKGAHVAVVKAGAFVAADKQLVVD